MGREIKFLGCIKQLREGNQAEGEQERTGGLHVYGGTLPVWEVSPRMSLCPVMSGWSTVDLSGTGIIYRCPGTGGPWGHAAVVGHKRTGKVPVLCLGDDCFPSTKGICVCDVMCTLCICSCV